MQVTNTVTNTNNNRTKPKTKRTHGSKLVRMTPRRAARERLFLDLYGQLEAMPCKFEPTLSFLDSYNVMELLSAHLPHYKGPLAPEHFLSWTARFIRRKAHQFASFQHILSKHSATIYSAIRDNMQSFAKDCAIELDDVKAEIWKLIFDNSIKLSKPGTASLRTRLNKLIERHCWSYHVRNNKNRLRIVTTYRTTLTRQGIEVMSEAELVSNRWDEDEPDYCAAPIAA